MNLKDFFYLPYLNLVVKKRNCVEALRVLWRYYHKRTFLGIDAFYFFLYLFCSPYTLSKYFLKKKGKGDIYVYGETPLTTMDAISKECGITKDDVVYELGCGRGKTVFWLRCFLGCRVVGIEWIYPFVYKAELIQEYLGIEGVEFRFDNMLTADLEDATVVYLYGTCLEDEEIQKLIKNVSQLPAGTKIITVSYPLTAYDKEGRFTLDKAFSATFTWGEGSVYLQHINP